MISPSESFFDWSSRLDIGAPQSAPPLDRPKCLNCKAPLSACDCQDCKTSSVSSWCHLCQEMHRAVIRNTFLSNAQSDWQDAERSRRNRMGL